MFEYDAPRAAKFADKVEAMFTGDQASPADLHRALAHGPYHVVIDDGGHSMKQQITSLATIFPSLPPGGLNILEDLSTSSPEASDWHRDQGNVTTVAYVSDMLRHMHRLMKYQDSGPIPGAIVGTYELAALALSIDCVREACVFVRNERRVEDVPQRSSSTAAPAQGTAVMTDQTVVVASPAAIATELEHHPGLDPELDPDLDPALALWHDWPDTSQG